jgi:AcrR family transcriptional regulator
MLSSAEDRSAGPSQSAASGVSPLFGRSAEEPRTRREAEKAQRRRDLLAAAGRLFGMHGFSAVALGDIGREVGVSGQAIYRHFHSKQDLLAHLLLEVSRWLLDGGTMIEAEAQDPEVRLDRLIGHHVAFACAHAGVIDIQERELFQLAEEPRRAVRRMQREYADIWSAALAELHPQEGSDGLHTRVHAIFGLINSTNYSTRRRPAALSDSETLAAMARAAAHCRTRAAPLV